MWVYRFSSTVQLLCCFQYSFCVCLVEYNHWKLIFIAFPFSYWNDEMQRITKKNEHDQKGKVKKKKKTQTNEKKRKEKKRIIYFYPNIVSCCSMPMNNLFSKTDFILRSMKHIVFFLIFCSFLFGAQISCHDSKRSLSFSPPSPSSNFLLLQIVVPLQLSISKDIGRTSVRNRL